MDFFSDPNLLNVNLQNAVANSSNTNLFSAPNPNDPNQTALYFQQKFSDIFSDFLTTSSVDSGDLTGSNSSDLDSLLGSSTTDSLLTNSNYELVQLMMAQNGLNAFTNIDQLNKTSALIGETASYSYNGARLTGIIQSVVNNNNQIFLKIDDNLVALDQIAEIKKGTV
ncbi:MAG: hypothetical protein PHV30_03855 [Candidatus Margulisbacteria bacterium]|nr:hypothetical protein [Candidatus Margulisiibacteriota bacterium]